MSPRLAAVATPLVFRGLPLRGGQVVLGALRQGSHGAAQLHEGNEEPPARSSSGRGGGLRMRALADAEDATSASVWLLRLLP